MIKKRKRPRKHLIKKIKKDDENKDIEFLFNNLNIELEERVNYKTRLRKEE